MSENLFGLTVAADKGLDDLQCQRLLSENRRYQEVMLQYRNPAAHANLQYEKREAMEQIMLASQLMYVLDKPQL